MSGQKTYWHLLNLRRKPTEYEIVTSQLDYWRKRGLEVDVPLAGWTATYHSDSSLVPCDWDSFSDPRQTTYTKYTEIQQRKETYVAGLLQSIENTDYDQLLTSAWLQTLEGILPTLRFPFHGLQMLACYIGAMAPAGRISLASGFQAADEIRRIQRIAYRMAQLQMIVPGFGNRSKDLWLVGSSWQPLREVIERLLATYDWGEAFVALNIVMKPLIDELFMVEFGRIAREEGDYLLEQILHSLNEDCRWHREWSTNLLRMITSASPENRKTINSWLSKWCPPIMHAITVGSSTFQSPTYTEARTPGSVITRINQFYDSYLEELGFETPCRVID